MLSKLMKGDKSWMENPGAGMNFRKLSEDYQLKPLNDILASTDEDVLSLSMGIVKIIDVSVGTGVVPKKVSLKDKFRFIFSKTTVNVI